MNHLPFRDWLLSDEKLSDIEEQRLQEHLQSCAECVQTKNAWLEVESAIHRSPKVIPQPGFTSRWQAHLAEYRQLEQKRHSWIGIGVISFVILSLLGFSISQVWILIQSPGIYLASIFNRGLSILSLYLTFQDIVNPFRFSNPFFVFLSLFFITGMVSFMSVLWLATVRKLSLVRRVA